MPSHAYQNCTTVTPDCPVSATTYGYAPNLGVNVLFLILFAVLFLAHFPLAYIYKLWGYSIALAIGCFLETAGYVGRVMMHYNAWSKSGFPLQIICLILGPSFVAASIYLTLKHLINYYGAEYSRLKPRLYTWVFIGCDAFSFLLQAGGGGLAASAGTKHKNLANTGNSVMIGGIIFQVVTMAVAGLLAVDFAISYRKRAPRQATRGRSRVSRPLVFCVTSAVAYIAVLIRCIYRIPEMAGGWGNSLMRKEAEFLILDGLMVLIGVVCLTLSYPGYMFPGMMKSAPHAVDTGVHLEPLRKQEG